jgi:hypothetical protein
MTDSYQRIARMDEEFPGLLAALKPGLKGLIPDDINFTEDSYDELFIILASALYYVRDAKLRMAAANKSGGNPRLVGVLMDEGKKDKDAVLAEKILDRIAPYVPVLVFMESLKTMYASKASPFLEYHGAIKRITADLFRISAGFKAAEHCPLALVQWASGPLRGAIYEELHKK